MCFPKHNTGISLAGDLRGPVVIVVCSSYVSCCHCHLLGISYRSLMRVFPDAFRHLHDVDHHLFITLQGYFVASKEL